LLTILNGKVGGGSGTWTNAENQQLMDALQIHGKRWAKIRSLIPTRSRLQILSRAQYLKSKLKERDDEEAKKVLSILLPSCRANFKFAEVSGQCYSDEECISWTEDEKNLFLQGLKVHGRCWVKIANDILTRSKREIRNYGLILLKQLKEKRLMLT
jgi:hypothetical protein